MGTSGFKLPQLSFFKQLLFKENAEASTVWLCSPMNMPGKAKMDKRGEFARDIAVQ